MKVEVCFEFQITKEYKYEYIAISKISSKNIWFTPKLLYSKIYRTSIQKVVKVNVW